MQDSIEKAKRALDLQSGGGENGDSLLRIPLLGRTGEKDGLEREGTYVLSFKVRT